MITRMEKTHKTQHKSRRDDSRSKELSDSKKEVWQLKRQVARLRKELEITKVYMSESELQHEDSIGSNEMTQRKQVCPCGSFNTTELKVPSGKVLVWCASCKERLP